MNRAASLFFAAFVAVAGLDGCGRGAEESALQENLEGEYVAEYKGKYYSIIYSHSVIQGISQLPALEAKMKIHLRENSGYLQYKDGEKKTKDLVLKLIEKGMIQPKDQPEPAQ
ncbi:MAG: hypothetical protein DYH13_05980 [Alphaproteobacteria bacterium PRO2]|nr:hypothetical protein [Alphaproteobacteria bacterium PRO2]